MSQLESTAKRIPLTRGYFALVDEKDYQILSAFEWKTSTVKRKDGSITAYAYRLGKPYFWKLGHHIIFMHQAVCGYSHPDHKDGDGLNNQSHNLRPATHSQNMMNRRKTYGASKFKGVDWQNKRSKWRARIRKDGKWYYLGLFKDEVDAATAYNFAAHDLFGEFSKFNVPIE